jgi:hypothetical protein
MRDEGYISIDSRRFGLLAGLRKKQWWSFEGLDPDQGLYYVFLALQAFPADYVSLKVIDYKNDRRWTEDHLGSFRTAPGEAVDVRAEGKWGSLRFQGRAEDGWNVEVETPNVAAKCMQTAQSPANRDRLLTQHIDYSIQQFVMTRSNGVFQFDGKHYALAGYGYHEHAWGVQPRHSTAHWMHFWCPETAGVVMDCFYDSGVPHHYTYLWHKGQEYRLHSPAHFTFDPAHPDTPWQVQSPDLELRARPLAIHHNRMQIPPLLAYIDIDYYENLIEIDGFARVHGKEIALRGSGKMDHNWNRW